VIGFASPQWTVSLSQEHGAQDFDVQAAQKVDTFAEGPLKVVFAGAVYNRAEIDERYGPSASDAQRLARLFAASPARFVQHLRGVFAFVIRDGRTGAILAGHDRLGIVPMFFSVARNVVTFSPSLRLLCAHPDVSREPNIILMAEDIADVWGEAGETYIGGVRRLLPSMLLRISDGKQSSERYWNPADGQPERDLEEVFEKFSRLLGAAVERFLAMGKTGIFLSGGVDSISVAATAKAIASDREIASPHALSLFFTNSEMDEEHVQRLVARQLGLPLISDTLDGALDHRAALEVQMECSRRWPVPMGNIWLPAFIRLASRGRDAGCQVLITGGGGDEWLGVAPHLAADLLRSGRLVEFVQLLAYMRRSHAMPMGMLLHNFGWMFGVKQLIVSARNRLLPAVGYDIDASRARRGLPDWFAPDPVIRRAVLERLIQGKRKERIARSQAASLYEFEMQRPLQHPLVMNDMETKFSVGEEVGVGYFEPYWDAELVDLLYRTPPDILSHGAAVKGLVHSLIKRSLPGFTIPKQTKIALGSYYQSRIRSEAQAAWQASSGLPALSRLGLIHPKKFSQLVEGLLKAKNPPNLWLIPHVLSIEAWAATR